MALEACSYLPVALVNSINQPKALIVIEVYDVVVTNDRARWRGQDMGHKKLKREAGDRKINEAASDHNTIGSIHKRNIMALSRNYFCNGNVRMRYLCIVQLRIDVNSIKIFSVGQQCLYSEFISPATTKPA
jgi:hypothetical protein